MADWKLTDYDLDLTNGDVTMITGPEAIAQDIQMGLRTWLGESIYDRSAGVPYLQVIFKRGTPIGTIEQILKEYIESRRGVIQVTEITVTLLDPMTRQLKLSGSCTSIDGDVDFSDIVISQ